MTPEELQDFRNRIDAIDDELVRLLASRATLRLCFAPSVRCPSSSGWSH